MVKLEWFQRYKAGEEPAKFERIIQSWDTANKPTELADYSVCTTWGIFKKKLYLLHVYRERVDYPTLKRKVRELKERFKAGAILIEDKASGTQLIQELARERVYGVRKYVPDGDKVMRLHAVTGTIESGLVYIPAEAPWLPDYLSEMRVFPKGRNDDQVDSTAQFLEWVKNGMGPNWEGLTKM